MRRVRCQTQALLCASWHSRSDGAPGRLFLFLSSLIGSHGASLIYNYITVDNGGLLILLPLPFKCRLANLYHHYTRPGDHLTRMSQMTDGSHYVRWVM